MKVTKKATKHSPAEVKHRITDELQKRAGWKRVWPMYPFREGYISCVYDPDFPQAGPKHGKVIDPLTKEQICFMKQILQAPFNYSALGAFLIQKCGVAQLDNLTWPDILWHFEYYARRADADAGGHKIESSSKINPEGSKEAQALICLVEHPEWSNTKIAKAIGVNRTTLYKWKFFKDSRKLMKEKERKIPYGNKDETGKIEAWD
ncbi:MAG: hypothetical protein JW749_03610 [Sedimentisphaerales bacterium]|nr:hypothetical protein [Sedimentisphaerales bacterium]